MEKLAGKTLTEIEVFDLTCAESLCTHDLTPPLGDPEAPMGGYIANVIERDGFCCQRPGCSNRSALTGSPRLSPDEQFIAMTIDSGDGGDGGARVYTYDRRRSTFSLLRGLDESVSTRPVWTPDGEWIYYAAETEGDFDIYRAPVDRSAPPERFLERPGSQLPNQVSPDGKFLLFRDGGPPDVWVVALDGGEPEPFVAETHVELHATFSPDGSWVAFASDASGRFEVYCTPFPGPGRITQISSNGGVAPVWAKDGSRIYYSVFGALMEAEVVPGSDLEFDAPREVVAGRVIPPWRRGTSFDSARDGRLLVSNSCSVDRTRRAQAWWWSSTGSKSSSGWRRSVRRSL